MTVASKVNDTGEDPGWRGGSDGICLFSWRNQIIPWGRKKLITFSNRRVPILGSSSEHYRHNELSRA